MFVLFFGYRFYGIRNVPRTGPVILASSHQSFLDPILVGMPLARPMNSMARGSLFRNRLFGTLLRNIKAFPVERQSADLGAMREALKRLNTGGQLLLFPEGMRTSDGSIGTLHPGLAMLAARSQAQVVPVVIDGAFECWPRHRKMFRPGRIWVSYGRPMRYGGQRRKEAEEFMRQLRASMVELHSRLRAGRVRVGQGASGKR